MLFALSRHPGHLVQLLQKLHFPIYSADPDKPHCQAEPVKPQTVSVPLRELQACGAWSIINGGKLSQLPSEHVWWDAKPHLQFHSSVLLKTMRLTTLGPSDCWEVTEEYHGLSSFIGTWI